MKRSLALAIAALCACAPMTSHPRAEDPSLGPLRPRWSLNINESVNAGQDPKAAADPALWHDNFLSARALGFEMVRMDLPWKAFVAPGGGWDAQVVDAYRQILQDAAALGLEVQVVISHVPDAEMELYRQGRKAELYAHFEAYTQMLAESYGTWLHTYQLLNETNTHDFPLAREDTWQMLLAGDRGVRQGDPDGHECAVNFLGYIVNGGNWISDAERTMDFINRTDPENTIGLIGVDEYPGTWTVVSSPGQFDGVDRLVARLEDPSSSLYRMHAGVMETGFSSFVPRQPWVNRVYEAVAQLLGINGGGSEGATLADEEALQAEWYAQAIPALRDTLAGYNGHHPGTGFLFVNVYTLHDDFKLEHPPFNPESNFGLLHDDRTPKPVADVIRGFTSSP